MREIVDQCLDYGWGVVQMPCPEQHAWGGVIKRRMLMSYGTKGQLIHRFRSLSLPLFVGYTRFVYRKLAKATASQIDDYLRAGFRVMGVVGIDGSPSCGVGQTLDLEKSFDLAADIDLASVTMDAMNAIIRQCLVDGNGIFTALLQAELKKRHRDIPYLAHNLMDELEERPSRTELPV